MDKSSAVLIDQSDSSKCRSSPIEGVAFNNQLINQSLEVNLLSSYNISSLEGDSACSSPLDHSQPSMQIRYVKPEVSEGNHCLRPYISKSSYIMDASNNLAQNAALNSTLNNSNISTNSTDLANNTLEQSNLLNFVENVSTNSPNFCTPSQQRCGFSRANSMNRSSRLNQIRARNLARMKHS